MYTSTGPDLQHSNKVWSINWSFLLSQMLDGIFEDVSNLTIFPGGIFTSAKNSKKRKGAQRRQKCKGTRGKNDHPRCRNFGIPATAAGRNPCYMQTVSSLTLEVREPTGRRCHIQRYVFGLHDRLGSQTRELTRTLLCPQNHISSQLS